ncbi:MAG: cytochrome c3 family protein [Acidobacteria bacterium]|uniref:Cytochrome c3 family protein n=1 Tax=Candidatus Polarisedimenticola svalbardensis TaxID=2886004 RepID=A0A8J7CL38_9BACT|nr:cytochrome c3 family protein [Candidatus Polarisedimenticola svalbardensis]
MNNRRPRTCSPARLPAVAVAVLGFHLLVAPAVLAADPPHWYSTSLVIGCTEQCHSLHNAAGGGLTRAAGNANLCQSCHNPSGLADQAPIPSSASAIPGFSGSSHAFGVPAVNGAYSTERPLNTEMDLRIMGDNVVCSTCHDQHAGTSTQGGTPKISTPEKVTSLGAGTASSQGTFNGALGVWYLLEIDGGGTQVDATFRWSKDNGTSWMVQTVPVGNGSPVVLDSGVEVVFSGVNPGDFVVGEQWEFFGTWPFLRTNLDSGDINSVDKFCRDCHRNWVMTHDTDLVAGGGVRNWDGNFKSHPVGVTLNANGLAYDRAQPLDGNGQAQTAGASPDVDGNPTNDLAFDSSGNVQCLSCHGVHYADSNTATVDAP